MTTSAANGYSPLLSSSIKTTQQYEDEKASKPINNEMGQQAFLTLFTTQLKNQNPLDPMDNQTFVAQLAQFSQLEASQSMKSSMDTLVKAMTGDRMLTGTSMIGRMVGVNGGTAVLQQGRPVSAFVNLPNGAEAVSLQVLDSTGAVVRSQTFGSQPVGDMSLTWDGTNDQGVPLPDGSYSFIVTATSMGQTKTVTPDVMSQVVSASNAGTSDGTWLLQVQGGKTIGLTEVQRVSN
ncbi:MAG: Basal-body rod modification protein FlgD [Pseudomonadota bacterium]